MSQFGAAANKVPPWQRPQHNLGSLLGQHPNVAAAGAANLAGQLVMAGQQPPQQQPPPPQQAQQYAAQVQQSIIQAPGLTALPALAAQQSLQQQQHAVGTVTAQAPPQALVQNTLSQASLMGQPPISTQPLQQLQQHQTLQQQTLQQQQQALQQHQQTQVATVQYPAPRPLAPASTFTSLPNTLNAPPVLGIPPISSTPTLVGLSTVTQQPPQQQQQAQQQQQQQAQKQRVFTGTITKLCADFGFVDDDVFFQTSCVIGPQPNVSDRVLVEASYNPTMPFKWNANRVQVIPVVVGGNRDAGRLPPVVPTVSRPSVTRPDGTYNAVPPPNFAPTVPERRPYRDSASSYSKVDTHVSRRRSRSPRPSRRERDDPKDKEKDNRAASKDRDVKRKRSRSRDRSTRSPRSPARRRTRVTPRYNVQVPKLCLQIEEANILELRKRYNNLYIPSDVFATRPLWNNTFPSHKPFTLPRAVGFHVMHKDVDSVLPNDAVYDPPDASHLFSAKVMLLSVPPLEEIYRRSCSLTDDSSGGSSSDSARDALVHPTRLINFCVGLRGKSETMAIGGHWSPSLDGPNPDKDPSVLIRTAIRTCMALTGIDLSPCTTWYRFAEIYYRRADSGHGKSRSGSNSSSSCCQCSSSSNSGFSSSGVPSSNISSVISFSSSTTISSTDVCVSASASLARGSVTGSSSNSSSSAGVMCCSSCGLLEPGRVETTVIFLPDVWNICPTKLEWDGLHLNYKRQLDRKLAALTGVTVPEDDVVGVDADEDVEQTDDDDQEIIKRKDPTHWSQLDVKNLKVVELRQELDARLINSRGLRSQLVARLTKVLKQEQDKEEADKASVYEANKNDDITKKDEEDKRKDEEKRKRDEEDKKKEEEEKRRQQEKERAAVEKRHSLPETPMLLVHPSRYAKAGKFDAATMSLSVLLDYRQEDNKEHSFEVSLFAELFNEMLMRDFAFRIYRALVEASDKLKDEEKRKDKEDDGKRKEENRIKETMKDDTGIESFTAVSSFKSEDEGQQIKRRRRDKFKTESDQTKYDEEDAILDLDFEAEEEEFFKEDAKAVVKEDERSIDHSRKDQSFTDQVKSVGSRTESRDGSRRRNSRGRSSERSSGKDGSKKTTVTVDPFLLLAFVYFDTTRTGYIVDKDLEDIINLLGLNLSRAQLKKLTSKVLTRDVLYYRQLTDVTIDEKDLVRPLNPSPAFLEALAKGNCFHLPVFKDDSSLSKRNGRGNKSEDSLKLKEGVVRYEGSLVDVTKLMQQLQRSEKALNDTEEKLRTTQAELSTTKEEMRRVSERNSKLNRELRQQAATGRGTESELHRSMEDNHKYMTALMSIKDVLKPLVRGLELDLDESIDIKPIDCKTKIEDNRANGTP